MADNDEQKKISAAGASSKGPDRPAEDDDGYAQSPNGLALGSVEKILAPTDDVARAVAHERSVAENVASTEMSSVSSTPNSTPPHTEVAPATAGGRAYRMPAEPGEFMLSGSPVALRVAKIDGQSSAHSALPPGGASGTGTVTNPPVTGAGPAEMSPMGASGTGTVTNASARGTLSAVLAPIALRATGTVTIPRVTGSGMSGVPPAGVRGPGSATLRTQGDETILPEDGEAILTESGPGRPRSPAPAGGTGARSAPMSGNADVIRAEGSGARGTVNPALSGRAQFNFDARGTATALSGNEAAGPLASYAKVGAALLSSGGARPESVNDQPTDTDHIGFKPYVDALAQFLMSERTLPPLTVSLEGEWGAGKSSFMAQLDGALNRLAGTKRAVPSAAENNAEIPRIISFNAWRHDKDEAVWASFALEFARGVAPTGLRD